MPPAPRLPTQKVTITDIGPRCHSDTITNESGNFTQRFLIVGRYRVRVEAAGFKTFVQDNVGVSVDTETRVDVADAGRRGDARPSKSPPKRGILKTERSDVATTYSEKTVTEPPGAEPALHELPVDDARRRLFPDLADRRVGRESAGLLPHAGQRPELRRHHRTCSTAPTITTPCSAGSSSTRRWNR